MGSFSVKQTKKAPFLSLQKVSRAFALSSEFISDVTGLSARTTIRLVILNRVVVFHNRPISKSLARLLPLINPPFTIIS